jgi:hypothetical protein
MCSDAFKPRPVVDDEGNEVPGLMEIDSQKVNKVCGQKKKEKSHERERKKESIVL